MATTLRRVRLAAMKPLWGFVLTLGLLLPGCSKSSSGHGAAVSASTAEVISVDPPANADDVAIEQIVAVTFSQPMRAETIDSENFQLWRGSERVAAQVVAGSRFARLTPLEPLLWSTDFELVLTPAIQDASGRPLPDAIHFTFRTRRREPFQIIKLAPAAGQSFVSREATIRVSFSRALDPASIHERSLEVRRLGGAVAFATLQVVGKDLLLTPEQPLALGGEYEARIRAGVAAIDGDQLEVDHVWPFEVRPEMRIESTQPRPDAEDVALETRLEVRFSVALDPSTVHGQSFAIQDDADQVVPGTIEIDRELARFLPSQGRWLAGRRYHVTITEEIQDTDGLPLSQGLEWEFTTQPGPFPPRAVYVALNVSGTSGNRVAALRVQPDGRLKLLPESPYPTGGQGSADTLIESVGVCCDSRFLFVTNTGSRDVSVFRIRGDDQLERLWIGFNTGDALPAAMALHPTRPLLYVANFGTGTIATLSYDRLTGEAARIGPTVGTLLSRPFSLALSPDGERLFVGFSSGPTIEVMRIRPDGAPEHESQLSAGFGAVTGMTTVATGPWLYGGDFGSTGIHGYRIETPQLPKPLPSSPYDHGGSGEIDSAVSPDGRWLYVANRNSGSVSVLAIESDGALTEIPGSPFSTLGQQPNSIVVSRSGELVYVVNAISRTVAAFGVLPSGALQILETPVTYGFDRYATGMVLSEF